MRFHRPASAGKIDNARYNQLKIRPVLVRVGLRAAWDVRKGRLSRLTGPIPSRAPGLVCCESRPAKSPQDGLEHSSRRRTRDTGVDCECLPPETFRQCHTRPDACLSSPSWVWPGRCGFRHPSCPSAAASQHCGVLSRPSAAVFLEAPPPPAADFFSSYPPEGARPCPDRSPSSNAATSSSLPCPIRRPP